MSSDKHLSWCMQLVGRDCHFGQETQRITDLKQRNNKAKVTVLDFRKFLQRDLKQRQKPLLQRAVPSIDGLES
jgi:hypothetical protein